MLTLKMKTLYLSLKASFVSPMRAQQDIPSSPQEEKYPSKQFESEPQNIDPSENTLYLPTTIDHSSESQSTHDQKLRITVSASIDHSFIRTKHISI